MLVPRLLLLAISAVSALPASQTPEDDIVPGKYIVTLKKEIKEPVIENHIQWIEGVHRRLAKRGEAGVDKVWTSNFKGYSGEFGEETINEILLNDDVLAVEPVHTLELQHRDYSNIITQKNSSWGLGSISHRTPGWNKYLYDASAGAGTWAYILDTGLYTQHSEFQGRAHLGYNAVPDTEFEDSNGHGTHCAGSIGGRTFGVAKKANLMSVKVFGYNTGSTETAMDGYEWAVKNITQTPGRTATSVISMSIGGRRSDALNLALRRAYENHGILTVVAAGNFASDVVDFSPGSEETAITVGAIDVNNIRLDYSNYGPLVDIFAPGDDVLSTWIGGLNNTQVLSGTSMAAPYVAGLVLYLRGKESGLDTPVAVTDRIKALATKNVVVDAGDGSPNLLAFNGVEKHRR